MSNPFQQQLLKAGLVSQQQVKKVNQEKARSRKQQNNNKKEVVVDENRIKVQQAAEEKLRRDRELNKIKEQQSRNKAISLEINQLIINNRIKRDESCEVVYNFEHRKKINRIYLNDEMKQQLIQGRLGIARIEGRYELVPASVAEKIMQRNDKRIILIDKNQIAAPENDEYAQYQIPDDLVW